LIVGPPQAREKICAVYVLNPPLDYRSTKPVTASNSPTACEALSTLMVVTPNSRAGFKLTPKIIEIDAAFGINTERIRHHLVDTRIGFAKADLCRLDDMVEQRHHLSDVKRSATEAADTVGRKVVGNTTDLELHLYALESLHHLGSQIS
jgi:hypothetical protein